MPADAYTTHELDALEDYIARKKSMLVAYSGGVDSTLLSYAAHEALGDSMVAVFARSPLLSIGEEERATSIAEHLGLPFEVIEHPGFELPEVVENVDGRCYYCKDALFKKLFSMAREMGIANVACGDNADDAKVVRPGARAAAEQGVLAPLAELGFCKDDIRSILREQGIENWNLASSPCLATRFPTGCRLDSALLSKVRVAEAALSDAYGFRLLRVRCDADSHARIELAPDELEALSESERKGIASILQAFGFSKVEFCEYRRS